MNQTLSTSAWVLHDLGLATSVGGAIFGKAGLHPAVRKIDSQEQRGIVTSKAWKSFSPINLLAHVAVVLTWVTGRSAITGRIIDRPTRTLVHTKDGLVAAYLLTGLVSTAAGYALSRSDSGSPPAIEAGGEPAARTPRRSRILQRISDVTGYANLIAGTALIGVTAVLATKAGRSVRWSLLSRLLP